MDFFHSIVHLLVGVSDRLESMPFSSSEPSLINCGCRFYTFLRVNATFLLLSRLQLTHGAEVEECSASVRSPSAAAAICFIKIVGQCCELTEWRSERVVQGSDL